MKKYIRRLFRSLVLLSALCAVVSAEEPVKEAESQLKLSGDVSVLSAISQKPSSMQNRSSFQMPEGRLGALWSYDSDVALSGEIIYGKARDSVDGRYNLQLESAYFEFRHLLSESHWMQYGLLPHPWEDLTEKFWGYRYLGARGPTLAFRYGYVNRSDLGAITGAAFNDWIQWSLMVVNGEGAGSEEAGPKKDFHLAITTSPREIGSYGGKFTLGLLVIEGAFDNIDPDVSQKERVSVLLGFEKEFGFSGSLELMVSKDPVDGVNQVVADKVDLSSQGGQVARGQGGSAILKWRTLGSLGKIKDKLVEAFARIDQWNPATSVSARGLRSQLLGIGFFPRQNLQISLAWSEVLYENNHAASVRDSSDLLLAARMKW